MARRREAEFNVALFGERLRAIRANRTLEDVQNATGITMHALSRYERGQVEKVPLDDAIRLAAYYGLYPEELFALTDLYELPESAPARTPLERTLHRIREYLLLQPEEVQDTRLDLFNAFLDLEERRKIEQEQVDAGVLPAWYGKRPRREPEEN